MDEEQLQFGSLYATKFASSFGTVTLVTLLPTYIDVLDPSGVAIGLFIAGLSVARTVGVVPLAWAGDRYDKRALLLAALAVSVVAYLLFPLVETSLGFIAVRVLQGFGVLGTGLLGLALVGDLASKGTRANYIGRYNSFRFDTSDLPETVAPGSVLLVTGASEPATDAIPLRLLHRYASPDDAAVVVSTGEGVEETTEAYSTIVGDAAAAQIGVVDTVSRGQNLTAFHRDVPTIFTPGPADLARVGVAIDNLAVQLSSGASHLVVRSVTPFFDDATAVTEGMERTFGHWSEEGLVVLGVDFTVVDEPTMTALTDLADGVVEAAVTGSGRLKLQYGGTPTRPGLR